MINVDKFSVAMLFIGAGLGGLVVKILPLPSIVSGEALSVVFILIGVVFLIWR
ncbi:Uncharacterised protein [uncultured archaeon]|nr:Uncharacterised protein [uncultured archaeon]